MEFHLHQVMKNKDNRTPDWALAHCLHLRPDSILAAMLEGTTMLAEPAATDMSFKRPAKNAEQATSQVMWAMENEKVLKAANAVTPKLVNKVAKMARKKLSEG